MNKKKKAKSLKGKPRKAKAPQSEGQKKAARRLHRLSLERARRDYVKTHWGELGKDQIQQLNAADPNEPSAALGELVAVVYRTVKRGDDGPTEYEHHFKGPLPWLTFNDGGLLILGGGYTVSERGIVR